MPERSSDSIVGFVLAFPLFEPERFRDLIHSCIAVGRVAERRPFVLGQASRAPALAQPRRERVTVVRRQTEATAELPWIGIARQIASLGHDGGETHRTEAGDR